MTNWCAHLCPTTSMYPRVPPGRLFRRTRHSSRPPDLQWGSGSTIVPDGGGQPPLGGDAPHERRRGHLAYAVEHLDRDGFADADRHDGRRGDRVEAESFVAWATSGSASSGSVSLNTPPTPALIPGRSRAALQRTYPWTVSRRDVPNTICAAAQGAYLSLGLEQGEIPGIFRRKCGAPSARVVGGQAPRCGERLDLARPATARGLDGG